MTVFRYKRSRVALAVVQGYPTTFPYAQLMAKTSSRTGARKVWTWPSVAEAKRAAVQICVDTIGTAPGRLKFAVVVVREGRRPKYGLEVIDGRRCCEACTCPMRYERFGKPVCAFHRTQKASAPCPDCQPKKHARWAAT